jgi:dTMP kinase
VSGRGRLVTFEGGEGCGKSTQAVRLAAALDAVLTHEPGATPLGEQLRALVLDRVDVPVSPRAEALLLAADRAQHVADIIRPALDAGRHVVTDRYVGSSLAYQGFGRGLPLEDVRALSTFATDGLVADVVVLLVVSPDEAARRTGAARDKVEAAGDEFHRRVAAGFDALAAAEPDRWAVIDGDGSEDAVYGRIRDALVARGIMAP